MNGRADEELRRAAAPIGAGPWEHELEPQQSLGTLGRGETKLWTLLRSTVSLHSLSRAEDVAAQVLDVVLGCLDADRVVVCRREPGINFQVLAQCGADPECLAIALDESRRLAQHEPAMGAGQLAPLPERDSEARDRAAVCVPIQRRTRIAGTIYAARSRPESPFEARDVDFLRLLAAHAAIVLEKPLQEPFGSDGRVAASQPAASVQTAGSPTSHALAATVFDLVRPLNLIERDAILAALRQHKGNRTAAAAALDISVRKLQYRIKEYQEQGFSVR